MILVCGETASVVRAWRYAGLEPQAVPSLMWPTHSQVLGCRVVCEFDFMGSFEYVPGQPGCCVCSL